MPISDHHRCIFIHIPKTGGTSLEAALGMFHRWQDENTALMFGLIQSSDVLARGWLTRFLQHASWGELCEIVPEDARRGYLSFSWVRNPWERMVSVFSNKDPHMLGQARQAGVELSDLDFESFLAATREFQHVHLRPQHEFIVDVQGRQQVDFIGRFEHFAADFSRLCAALRSRGSLSAEPPLPHRNASPHRPYRDFYTDRGRQLVAERYGADIEAFRYVF